MNDFAAYRKSAIRYWERRRIGYNVLLIPCMAFGFLVAAGMNGLDDREMRLGWVGTLLLFGGYLFTANLCYSLVYATEFIFGSEDARSMWRRWLATAVFTAGTLFSLPMGLVIGRDIANIAYGLIRLF